ncbi:hypothetical protein JEO88_03125 [Candidatus Saccharibacteria bacterium]|nr:hypothetical protein [Candidatus Saccharibacteria bacterium]
MIRELKFRVWSKKQKTYAYKHPFNVSGSFYIAQNGVLLSDYGNAITPEIKQNDFVIERFTGLRDKNDHTIYEGDIVSEHNGDLKGVVKQAEDGQWVIYWDNIPDGRSVLFEHSNFCGVIGNIHDTHELLEK